MKHPVTLEKLKSCHMEQAAHLNGDGWFGYIFCCVEYPRLKRLDKYTKKDRSVESTWRVDGTPVEDLEAAIAALNVPPEVSDEERALLRVVPTEFQDIRDKRTGDQLAAFMRLTDKGLIESQKGRTRLTPLGVVMLDEPQS